MIAKLKLWMVNVKQALDGKNKDKCRVKHLRDVNENYWKHGFEAIKYFTILQIACLQLFIHAIIPPFFERSASDKCRYIIEKNSVRMKKI